MLGGALLDQPPPLHDADAMREAPHQPQVMGDEEQCHSHLGLQRVEQGEDLHLYRHVERRGRLVGDQQARLAGERHRDHAGAAGCAAGEPGCGYDVDAALRLGDAGLRQQLDGAPPRPARRPMPW